MEFRVTPVSRDFTIEIEHEKPFSALICMWLLSPASQLRGCKLLRPKKKQEKGFVSNVAWQVGVVKLQRGSLVKAEFYTAQKK